VLMQLMLGTFLLASVSTLMATVLRGDSEVVIAIRYLQPKGTSHSHLYLYREDGKLLRQLTNDNSGQDVDPIFAPDGETIVLTREKPNDTREFWSIDPRGAKLKKLEATPDWYSAAKSSPYFTRGGEEEAPSSSPTPPQKESPSAPTPESAEQGEHQSATALDALANAEVLHVRLKVPDKNVDPKELPQYWLVLDSKGQAQYIGHTEMPLFSQAANSVVYCSFDYAPSKEKLAPPQLGPPVDDKIHGFNDIEQHKFDWAKKIVRLEVTPKLLQSEQIGESTYRAFLKDTATPNHYGMVEFPYDALVRLGFLKKTVSGTHAWEELQKMGALGRTEGEPVSFYVQVVPIGEKPAARTVVVGTKIVSEADGSAIYTW
jgi:hypothetical protein